MIRTPILTTDTIIEYPDGSIVLVVRGTVPFKGKYALPGGHVEIGETVEQAAVREAKEETGLDIELTGLFGVYSDPNRDPRGHTCSIVWRARAIGGKLHAETDAADAIITKDYLDLEYAFDHRQMIEDYVKGNN